MTHFFNGERNESPAALPSLVSRRTLIVGSGSLLLAGAAGLTLASPAEAASASDGKLTDVIAAAKSYVGKDLAQMNTIWSSKYKTSGDWCAIFVSWLLRGTNVKFNASSHGLYTSLPDHSTPKKGDIIYYRGAETSGHVGLVISVSGTTATTIEGNAGTGSASTNHVKEYAKPWAPTEVVGYARPTYK